MSCLLNTYGKITNLSNIINFLSPLDQNEDESSQKPFDEKWSNDWNWGDESKGRDNDDANNNKQQQQQQQQKPEKVKKEWLDLYQISVSPCGNMICIAYKTTIIVLHGKWDNNNQIKYTISSRISLETNEKEEITSIICIPIASQKKSGEGLLEWTCIMIGFNTGNIRMYTENGTLLVTQMFHDECVVKIKCRTNEPAKYIGWIDQYDEVQILYNHNVLVIIDGCSLYNYLKTARIYAAKSTSQLAEALSTLSLEYKKWSIEQDTLSDFASAGYSTENRFNQLFNASMIGGPNEHFQYNPPRFNKFLTCGNGPFFGIYSSSEDSTVLTGLALSKVVAGKVTNVLMNAARGWMGFNKATNVKQKPKIEPSTILDGRCGLPDARRLGESIIISPGNSLAATTDSFARVTLIDVQKGIATRMFKGYRDAQIGWFMVDDESDEKLVKKQALYLIIYAARRGLIEVWGCQQGVRVAAFNIGKKCKLIYPGFYMLSLNGSLLNEQSQVNKQLQCFIIDEEGNIKTLHIPFHLILSDKSNQRVRDTVLFKKIKMLLKNNNKETDNLWNEIMAILKDCKTPSIKEQILDRLLNTSYLSPQKVKDVLNELINQIDKQGENTSTDQNKLKMFCKYNCKLIESYVSITSYYVKTKNIDDKNVLDETETEILIEMLHIEKGSIEEFVNIGTKIKSKQIEKCEEFTLQNYLASFESSLSSTSNESKVLLKHDLSNKDKFKLGSFLFSCWFHCKNESNELENILNLMPLNKLQLFDLFVSGFLFQNEIYYKNLINLYELSSLLIKPNETSDINLVDFEYEFIPKLINSCECAVKLNCGLLLAWIFRIIAKDMGFSSKTIESLSTLCTRLLDMMKLYYLCNIGTRNFNSYLGFEFSLKNILQRGKGIISEIVGKHTVHNEFPPILLLISESDESSLDEIFKSNSAYKEFYDYLQLVRLCLPKSLEPDILLTNAAWESINLFNKNSEDVKSFVNSLKYCAKIENAILKQGITSMIWHSSISKKIAALTNSIERAGKAPKDRLLRKDTGLPETEVVNFLENSLLLLDLIMDANCSINEVPIFNYDTFWSDRSEAYLMALSQTTSTASDIDALSSNSANTNFVYNNNPTAKQLVEIAAEQKYVNYHLCLFHYQLVRILYFVMKYNMKLIRPLALFDTKGRHTLFSDLHTHPLISNDVDISIVNARKFFFTKIINSIVENVVETDDEKEKLDKETQDLFTIALNLSKEMNIDSEFVKRYYCSILYAIGYYNEAEKVLLTIKDKELIASQVLFVIGHKVNLILNDNFNANTMSMLSTNLSSWLKSLGPSEYRINKPSAKDSLIKLIGMVTSELQEECSEHKIAVELYDFISTTELKIIKNNKQI